MTGVLGDVGAHVSMIVCPSSSREAQTTHGQALRDRPYRSAAAAHAAPARRCTDAHGQGSRFQLHSRPPRQRLPSSLVTESASASASSYQSTLSRRGTSDER